MNILICGASGFIGRHLVASFTSAGHRVFAGVRRPTGLEAAPDLIRIIDFATPGSGYRAAVEGVDVEINAVGMIRATPQQFATVQTDAPIALFEACRAAGVRHFVQISALGSNLPDKQLPPFLASKYQADAYFQRALASNPGTLRCSIFRPSLIIGHDGTSSRLFRALASLPLPFVRQGDIRLQPVHIDDLCAAIVRDVEARATAPALVQSSPIDNDACQFIAAVGPQVMSFAAMLARYRTAMALPPTFMPAVPRALMYTGARLAQALASCLPARMRVPDWLAMAAPANLDLLFAGNDANASAFEQLLGRPQRQSWFARDAAEALRRNAIAAWSLPLMRVALALVWLLTALVSAGIFPQAQSLALLAQIGLPQSVNLLLLYSASALDALLGLATLFAPSRKLWWGQIGLVLGYIVIISLFLPDFWLHPFGPISKNLPILALLFYLLAEETRS